MAGRDGADSRVPVGRLGGPHGVRGFLRVESWTRPPESILDFPAWLLDTAAGTGRYELEETCVQPGRLLVRLAGVHDRTAAAELRRAAISVPRTALPALPAGEWYWADLIGLSVYTTAGTLLGAVDHLLETGANDVLVVHGERERLIPWIADDVVQQVDPAGGCLIVDWDPDF